VIIPDGAAGVVVLAGDVFEVAGDPESAGVVVDPDPELEPRVAK
jgi:hypothetical protein